MQVKVTSTEALEMFRASLIIFLTKAHRSLDEVGDEVRRTRSWLQHDQRLHWQGEARRRQKVLDAAQQEYMSARLSGLRDSTTAQQQAVHKAKRALAEAEEKLRLVKIWNRDFGSGVDPLLKNLEGLRYYLNHDLPKALSYLLQAQKTLEAYAAIPAPSAEPAPIVKAAPSA